MKKSIERQYKDHLQFKKLNGQPPLGFEDFKYNIVNNQKLKNINTPRVNKSTPKVLQENGPKDKNLTELLKKIKDKK